MALRVAIEFKRGFIDERVAAKNTAKDMEKLYLKKGAELVEEAERLWEDGILRQAEHEDKNSKKRKRGLTDKIFGTGSGLAIKKTSRGAVQGIEYPDIERLNTTAKYWRAQEYGVTSILMPRGVFVDRAGRVQPPRRYSENSSAEKNLFLPYKEFNARKAIDILAGGAPSDKNYRRDQRRRRQARRGLDGKPVGSGVGGREVKGHKGKYFIRDSWSNVMADMDEQVDKLFDRNWGNRQGKLF